MVTELLRARKKEDGTIHYYDVVKQAVKAGVKHADLVKKCNQEEPPRPVPIKAAWFSKIHRKNLQRPTPTGFATHAFPEETIQAIRQFWLSDDISRVSANKRRTVKRGSKKKGRKPQTEEIRYRKFTIAECWKKFQQAHPGMKCSRTSFFDYKPKNIKKPKSKQDFCKICKQDQMYRPALTCAHPANLDSNDREALAAWKFHKDTAKARDQDFKHRLKYLRASEALIVMDFKQNISLGKGPVQDSHVFFKAPQRTVFGAVAYFRANQKIYKVIFTAVSPILTHDSLAVKLALQKILGHGVFRHFGVKNVHFWMDNAGGHFRTFETLATLDSLGKKNSLSVTANYFAEYHGKSECDRHFGWISRIYADRTSYDDSKTINTTEDFMELYTSAVRSYGGCVIPQTGAVYDELIPGTNAGKLNVVPLVFSLPEVDEYLGSGECDPNSKHVVDVYDNIKRIKVRGASFALNLFYAFSFNNGVLKAQLHRTSRVETFRYSTVKGHKRISVKVGAKTAVERKYASLDRITKRASYHA